MILVLDGSGRSLKLALYENGRRIFELIEKQSKAERFPDMLQLALNQIGKKLSDLQEILVHNGPGSFTGLRTSLAFAQALCINSKRVLRAVGSLEAVSLWVNQPCLVVQKANPETFYVFEYGPGGTRVHSMLTPVQILEFSDLLIVGGEQEAEALGVVQRFKCIDFESIEWFDALVDSKEKLPCVQASELKVNYVQLTAAEKNLRKQL